MKFDGHDLSFENVSLRLVKKIKNVCEENIFSFRLCMAKSCKTNNYRAAYRDNATPEMLAYMFTTYQFERELERTKGSEKTVRFNRYKFF